MRAPTGAALLLGMLLLLGGCSAANQPPTAKISDPAQAAQLGAQVQFQAQAHDPDGRIKGVLWQFGDGQSSDQLNPSHTYKRDGIYKAILTVTDDRGATAQAQVTFHVQVHPKAVATLQQAGGPGDVVLKFVSGEAPLTVQFDASHSSAPPGEKITAYHWDFGDGSSSDQLSPTHTYQRGGSYQATLTITDSDRQQASDQVQVKAKALEALNETVELGGEKFHYKLYRKHTGSAAVASSSILLWYVLSSAQRPSAEQARALLLDMIDKARARPGISEITVFLFDRIKQGFMSSGDYSHYLGYAIWQGPKPPDKSTDYYLNRDYFDGKALTVLGYRLEEKTLPAGTPNCPACATGRIVLVDLYLQDKPICQSAVLNTIQEIARWRLISAGDQGFLINIYGPDISAPLGEAIGVYQLLKLDELPLNLLQRVPTHWDVATAVLKIAFGQIPACAP